MNNKAYFLVSFLFGVCAQLPGIDHDSLHAFESKRIVE